MEHQETIDLTAEEEVCRPPRKRARLEAKLTVDLTDETSPRAAGGGRGGQGSVTEDR